MPERPTGTVSFLFTDIEGSTRLWEGSAEAMGTAVARHDALLLKAPVLGLYGEADQGIPLTQVEAMKGALQTAKKTFEIKTYAGAPHGFHADYRPSYRKAEAYDGWRRCLDWFKRHGVA